MIVTHVIASVAVLALAGPPSLIAQTVQGQRYVLHMTSDGERELVATVRESGGRARIDLERSHDGSGGYIIVTDDARTLILVHPDQREYTVVDDTTFERIVGKALRVVAQTGVLQVQLRDVKIVPERLGPGESIAGHPTRRYRLTQEYRAFVGAFGIMGDEPVHKTVVTEYWVSPRLTLAPNPLLALLAGLETALAQRSASFVSQSIAARDSLFRGTPLRIVITSRSTDGDDSVKERRLEITDLAPAAFDPAIWAVPRGYTRRHSDFSFDVF
jgi:hypothetical protein